MTSQNYNFWGILEHCASSNTPFFGLFWRQNPKERDRREDLLHLLLSATTMLHVWDCEIYEWENHEGRSIEPAKGGSSSKTFF